MQSDFDVRQYLEIDDDRPVELRICHIAELWYGAVLSGRMKNHLDTIYNLFPDLVIVEGDRTGKAGDHLPEYDGTTKYITAYRKGGYLLQGAGDVVPPIINCLYGSVKSPKQSGPAKDIQIRVSGELCRNISLLTDLRRYYTQLICRLSPEQLDDFKKVFKEYIDDIADDLEKYPSYRTQLFPFSSDRLVLDLNNYLSKEFEAGNYADFFLWMNLGALLRNEINGLIDTYDSSFNLRKEAGNLTGKLKENHDLLLRIFENERKNHPSIRMMDPEPLLFPKGLPEIFSDGRFAVEEEEVPRALRDMILDSWKCEDRRHILLVGEGGIGKTVAMLTLPEEDWFKELGIPVIYVPLQRLDTYEGDLNRYIKEKIGSDNYERSIDLANRESEGHPGLLLLLDGFNEIPDKFKKKAEQYIREWMEKPGVQIITTSRLGFFLENRFLKYRLQPLAYDTVRSFLLSAGIVEEQLPGQKDRVWEVINVPLMLVMYTQIEKVRAMTESSSVVLDLDWKEPDNAAHIIWNYLQMELYRCIEKNDSTCSAVQYAVAILAVAPYICSRMSHLNKFYIKREKFHELIQEALIFYTAHQDMLGRQILKLRRKYDPYRKEDLFQKENMEGYARILIDNVALFQEQEICKEGSDNEDDIDSVCSLMHQNFRDALTAFFICSCLPKACCAKEKKELLDHADYYVKDYMAEYYSDRELVSVWDRHREEEPEDGQITFMLMDLIGRKRNYDYRELDLSGLDLTRTNLHRLLSRRLDICPLPVDRDKLSNTKISINCLSPNGHTYEVNSVAFSPNGRQVASGSYDKTVRVWDLESGECRVLKVVGEMEIGRSYTFSPDGRQLAIFGPHIFHKGYDVDVWDLESGEKIRNMGKSLGRVCSVAFSPDGRQLASGEEDGTVCVWDVASGEGRVLEGHADGAISVAFSPDSKQLASGSIDGTVRVWDLESGERPVLEGHTDRVSSVVFSPDGKQVASGSYDRTVRVWDLESGKCRMLDGHADKVSSVSFSPDGRQLASGGDDRTVRVWDVASGEGRVLEGHADKVSSVAFSPDGRQLASGGDDRMVRVWDLESGECRVLYGYHAGGVLGIAISPDGKQLAAGGSDSTVRVWDLAGGESRVLEGHTGSVNSVAFSPGGRQLASGASDSMVRIWDLASGESCVLGRHLDGVRCVAFSPDGRQLASGAEDRLVRVWDLAGGESLELGCHLDPVCGVAFSSDGRQLAWGFESACAEVRDLESGKSRVLASLLGGLFLEGGVSSVAFSSDGRQLAWGFEGADMEVWNLESGKKIRKIGQYLRRVCSVAFSPDGRQVAGGTEDGKVRLWDIEKEHWIDRDGLRSVLVGHVGVVNSVAFSPDGRQLVSGSDDSTVRIWDLDEYREVGKYAIIPHINLSGANFELAIISEKDKEMLRAAGARV